MTRHFDIFERLPNGKLNWVGCVDGLLEARQRVWALRAIAPGDYFVYDEVRVISEEQIGSVKQT